MNKRDIKRVDCGSYFGDSNAPHRFFDFDDPNKEIITRDDMIAGKSYGCLDCTLMTAVMLFPINYIEGKSEDSKNS